MNRVFSTLLCIAALTNCAAPEGRGLARTGDGSGAQVKFDVFAKPFPDIPLPNDFASRYDPSSPTRRRINASMEANTRWERGLRDSIDQLDGWGTYQSVTVGFTWPLDLHNLLARHANDDYAPFDDAVLLIDITPDSPNYCQRVPLDVGDGNFPLVLEKPAYFDNDRPGDNFSMEDREEDANHNGQLDLGEDLDMDGVLDHPNVLTPGDSTFKVMSFYERETNSLVLHPVLPLRENTTYAVVLTKRLTDEDGRPVRSPFEYINHTSQTKQLEPLGACLPNFNLAMEDVAFTWAYSTLSITRDFVAIRDGLYGLGPMQRLATEFPNDVQLLPVRDSSAGGGNTRIIPGDAFRGVAAEILQGVAGTSVTPSLQQVIDSHRAIDFYAVFSFESPQFFPRFDSEGVMLPLYDQTWKLNAQTGAAYTRPETITAFITVPKNRTGPVPVVIMGHGYTGSKADPFFYGGFLARYGIATIGMECVSHGLGVDKGTHDLVLSLLAGHGMEPFGKAVLDHNRAIDWDGDGIVDSGADYWVAYLNHTRDVVRQSAVDYMQLVRVLRSFDGAKHWPYNGHGLAGDFDGDGIVDVGGNAQINMMGGSLGGIMAALMAGTEPGLDLALPVSGAAGLADVGVRSIQGGVREAVNLRMLAPLFVTLKNADGSLDLWEELPSLNDLARIRLAPVKATLNEGDTAVMWNLGSESKRKEAWWKKEYRCGRVGAGGLLRVAVPADEGDELKLVIYPGVLPPQAHEGCRIPDEAKPSVELDTTTYDFTWWQKKHNAGENLTALGDGFGLRRQSPETRRFMGLAQLIVDQGDPINFQANVEQHTLLRYGTGETVATRELIFNTIGDMNVPVAAGASIGRAAGFLDLYTKDPRWGATPNRVLLDHGVLEAVERTHRYRDVNGNDTLYDVENFASIASVDDGFGVPRLSPPLRLVKHSTRVGGITGMLFPMVVPTGRHGFDTPDPSLKFNVGAFLLNNIGRWVQTGGEELPLEACTVDSSCPWIPPLPQ